MHDAISGGWVLSAVVGQVSPELSAAPPPAPAGDKQVVPLGAPGAPAGQTGSAPAGPVPGGAGQAQSAPSMLSMMLPLLLVLVVMIVLSSMSGRKEKKRREALLSAIKKHDKVQTLGGVIGTITDIDGDEVVLRLDEGRMRVSRGAIQTVLREARPGRVNGVIEDKDRRTEKAEV
ncbi:MAG: preprotein translocase subunit YajC [Phycisphaerales bacterium]|nr:preprotein translocase subunit YajC [Phycisphaerales bacterium]